MRTSRLRRWVLRGALLATAAVIALTADAAHADWQWGDVAPTDHPAVTPANVDSSLSTATNNENGANDWQWG